MRLFTHLLRADVRRLRLLFVVWVLVVAGATVLEGVKPRLSSMGAQQALGVVQSLVGIVKLLLMFLMVPMAVQLHPVVGSDAFWMTRPVSPRVLLEVKAAMLWVAIVLLTSVAHASLMAAYGVPPSTIALVAVERMLSETLWLSLLMVAAVLTPNLARYALLCGAAILAVTASASVTLAIAMLTGDLDSPGSQQIQSDGSATFVFMLLAIAAAGLLMWVQYRSRSRVRAVAAGIAGVAAAVLVSVLWPWSLLQRSFELPAWARESGAATLAADPASVAAAPEMPFFNSRRVWRSVTAAVNVRSLPKQWSAQPHLREATVHALDKVVLHTADRGSAFAIGTYGSYDYTKQPAMDAMGVRSLGGTGPDTDAPAVTILFLTDEEFTRAAPVAGRYDGRFLVQLARHEVEAVLPLRPDAVHHNGPYRVSVEGVSQLSSSVAVLICESRARSTFERRRHSNYHFFLRNRRTSEGIAGSSSPLWFSDPSVFLPLGFHVGASASASGFTALPYIVRFPAWHGTTGAPASLALTETWLADAELVVLRSTPDGAVERPLSIDPFKLETSPPGAPARATTSR